MPRLRYLSYVLLFTAALQTTGACGTMVAEIAASGDVVKLERAAGLLMFLDTAKGIQSRPKFYRYSSRLELTDFDQVEESLRRKISQHKQ